MKVSTIYQKSIKDPSLFSVLKKGSSNKKLGFKITSKRWSGKRLYSLTLVERETCPTSCHHWDDCYGNNMPFAHRFSTIGLLPKLKEEIDSLMQKHKEGIVIRLHVLGDFMTTEYVEFWEQMLFDYRKLCLFGYTGREEDSEVGKAIWLMNTRFSERCVIRYSRSKGYEGSNLYAAEESFEGASFDCPEQTGKVKDCASCGLCWTTQKTVRFLTH
jgi:hypothetical protein